MIIDKKLECPHCKRYTLVKRKNSDIYQCSNCFSTAQSTMSGGDMNEEYKTACFNCATKEELMMIAHRNEEDGVVGWLFVCEKCFNRVKDKYLKVNIFND